MQAFWRAALRGAAFGGAFVFASAQAQDYPTRPITVIVTKLNGAMVKILKEGAVKEKLGALGLAVVASTPDELAATVRDGIAVRGQLVKAANIQPE